MEVFTSGPELPSRPSTPTFGPDNPLALVSLLLGQTGLWYRSQVFYEAGQGKPTVRGQVVYPPGTRNCNLTPIITHLETETGKMFG